VNGRRASLVLGSLIVLAITGAYVCAGPFHSIRWTRIPSITVVSAPGDSRIDAIQEAVGFWNRTFVELGTPFRLGDIALALGVTVTD
jgi:hypothetical protein